MGQSASATTIPASTREVISLPSPEVPLNECDSAYLQYIQGLAKLIKTPGTITILKLGKASPISWP